MNNWIRTLPLVWLASVGTAAPQGHPTVEVTIRPGVLEALEQTRPKELLVHESVAGDPGRWMERLQGATHLAGGAKEGEELVEVRDGDRHLEVRKVSCAAFYGDLASLWRAAPRPSSAGPAAPSDDQASAAARSLLQSLGFQPTDLAALELSVSDELFELTRPDRPTEVERIVVGKNVEARRRIDGLFVYGAGSKLKVYVGAGAVVQGYTFVWRQWQAESRVFGHRPVETPPPPRLVQPIPTTEAFTRLRNDPLDHLTLAPVDRIDVERVDLGYYERSAVEPQRFLQPVYVFTGTATAKLPDGRESRVPYLQYVVALDEPLEPIWPETIGLKGDSGPKRPGDQGTKDEG